MRSVTLLEGILRAQQHRIPRHNQVRVPRTEPSTLSPCLYQRIPHPLRQSCLLPTHKHLPALSGWKIRRTIACKMHTGPASHLASSRPFEFSSVNPNVLRCKSITTLLKH